MSGGLVGTNKKPRAKVATRDITRGVPSRHWTAPPISGSRHFGHFVFGCDSFFFYPMTIGANFQGLAPAELVWPKTSQKRAHAVRIVDHCVEFTHSKRSPSSGMLEPCAVNKFAQHPRYPQTVFRRASGNTASQLRWSYSNGWYVRLTPSSTRGIVSPCLAGRGKTLGPVWAPDVEVGIVQPIGQRARCRVFTTSSGLSWVFVEFV